MVLTLAATNLKNGFPTRQNANGLDVLAGQSMPITFHGFDALCDDFVTDECLSRSTGGGGLEGNFPIVSLSGE